MPWSRLVAEVGAAGRVGYSGAMSGGGGALA